MKIRIEDDYERVLILFDDDKAECIVCHETKHERLYYCEQDAVLYCKRCLTTKKGCKNRMEQHIDLKIDTVEHHNTKMIISEGSV